MARRKINFADGFTSETAPTIGDVTVITDKLSPYVDDAAYVVGSGVAVDGSIYYNTTSNLVRYYSNGAWVNVVDESATQTLTNKTLTDTTLDGTTTIVNSTDLQVTDQNILINNGGNDASAEGAGITVDRTGTDGSIVYEDVLNSKWKAGALGSEIEIANVSGTQTLTNKTLSGGEIQSPNRLDVKKDTEANLITYAASASDGQLCFATDTLEMFQVVGNALVAVGSGSGGGGGLDIFYSESFENLDDLTSFTQTGLGTLALDTSTALNGLQGFKFTQVSGSLNATIDSPLIALDEKQQNTEIKIRFTAENSGADDLFEMQIENISVPIKNGKKIYEARFYMESPVSTQWTIAVATEAIGAVLRIDDVEISTDSQLKQSTVETQYLAKGTGNGYGSTDNKIRRYDSTIHSDGSGIFTETTTAANGTVITVNKKCEITLDRYDSAGSVKDGGFSINSSQLTTNIQSITDADRIGISTSGGSGFFMGLSKTRVFNPGDKIRVHDTGLFNATNIAVFSISAKAYNDGVITSSTIPVNEYSARITSADAITSQNVPWVDGVTSATTGTYVIDTTSAGFSTTAAYHAVAETTGLYETIIAESATSCTVEFRTAAADTLTDTDFSFYASAQAPDHKDLTANLIQTHPKIVYIKDVKSNGVQGGNTTADTVHTRDLNTVTGDTSFSSLSANQITLAPGEYDCDIDVPVFKSNGAQCYLYNVTDATIEILGRTVWTDFGGINVSVSCPIVGPIIITTPTIFEIRHWTQTGATNGMGQAASSGSSNNVDEIYTVAKITKVK